MSIRGLLLGLLMLVISVVLITLLADVLDERALRK